MITLKTYTSADKAAWNAFNKSAKNGIFMFDRDYMDYHADRFRDNSLMFYEDGKLIALLPLNLVEIPLNLVETPLNRVETPLNIVETPLNILETPPKPPRKGGVMPHATTQNIESNLQNLDSKVALTPPFASGGSHITPPFAGGFGGGTSADSIESTTKNKDASHTLRMTPHTLDTTNATLNTLNTQNTQNIESNLQNLDSKKDSRHDLSRNEAKAKYLKDSKEDSNDSQNLHFTESTTKNKDASHTLSMTTHTTLNTLKTQNIQNIESNLQNLDSIKTPESKPQKILYSHQGLTFGGFITDSSMRQHKMLECFKILKDYMRQNGIKRLIYKVLPYIYHKSPAQEDIYALFVNGARVFRTDCSSVIGLDSHFKMNELRKRCIKKAIKNDIKIIESTDFPNFVNLLNNVLRQRHNTTAVHNSDELALLHSRFSQNIRLFSALLKGEMIAASLVFEYDNLAHTQYLAANAVARELGGLDLLLKTLIDSYLDSKMYFDFGISNENNGMFLNEGLIAQKESFGARSVAHYFYEMLLDSTMAESCVTNSDIYTGGGG